MELAIGSLVVGAGPIGLGVLAMARLLLGEGLPVFVTDVVPYRLNLTRPWRSALDVREQAPRTGCARTGRSAWTWQLTRAATPWLGRPPYQPLTGTVHSSASVTVAN